MVSVVYAILQARTELGQVTAAKQQLTVIQRELAVMHRELPGLRKVDLMSPVAVAAAHQLSQRGGTLAAAEKELHSLQQ